jgi:hypothetical protein
MKEENMQRKIMVGLVLLSALCLVGRLAGFANGEGKKLVEKLPASGTESPFAGKVIIVELASRWECRVLEKVQMRKLGGKNFLVGTGAVDPCAKGRTVWVAMEAVGSIIEFDNVVDAKKAYELRLPPGAIFAPQPKEDPAPAPVKIP